jgi:hypothetical protein
MISNSHFSILVAAMYVLEYDYSVILLFLYQDDQLSRRRIFFSVPQMISNSHFSILVAAMYVLEYDYSVILLFL